MWCLWFDCSVIPCLSNRQIFIWVAEGPSTWEQIWKGVTLMQPTFPNFAKQWTIRRGKAHLLFHFWCFPQKRGQQKSASPRPFWNASHVNNSNHKHGRFSKYINQQFTRGVTLSAGKLSLSLRSRVRWWSQGHNQRPPRRTLQISGPSREAPALST